MDNIHLFKFFNIKFLKKYLLVIRESSVTNMLSAAPYLYIGKHRMIKEFEYKDIEITDRIEDVLELADQAQTEMINGVLRYLESKGIEETLENINRYIRKFASDIIRTYTLL